MYAKGPVDRNLIASQRDNLIIVFEVRFQAMRFYGYIKEIL